MIRTCLFVLSLAVAACFAAGEAVAAQLVAAWVDNSSGEAVTRIERRLDNVVAFAAIADVPPAVTEFVDTSVSPGARYCYRVLAHNADGASPYSDEVCAVADRGADSLELTIGHAGNGAGTVASTPAGIQCGSSCSAEYPAGTAVTLRATPSPGSTFEGWSGGGCAGAGSCILAGNAAVAITATFGRRASSVTVSKAGDVNGSIASSPAGIACGSTCFATYADGTTVTLTATPAAGSTFAGWSGGGCTGTGVCRIAAHASASVIAMFSPAPGSTAVGKDRD
jgi:List-Bact-rpt repeat protein